MGLFDDFRGSFQSDHQEFHNSGSFTHDALAGAVAYEATKAYENHCAENGQPDNHARAKELFAGFAAAATTQLLETKGRDAYDEYQARRAQDTASERFQNQVLDTQYDY